MKDYQVEKIEFLQFFKLHLWGRLHYYSHHIGLLFLLFLVLFVERINDVTIMILLAITSSILMFLVYVLIKFQYIKQYQLLVKDNHVIAVSRTLFKKRTISLPVEKIHTVFIGIIAKSNEDVITGENLKCEQLFFRLTVWLKDGDKFVLNNAVEAFELKSLDGFMQHLEENGIKVANPHCLVELKKTSQRK